MRNELNYAGAVKTMRSYKKNLSIIRLQGLALPIWYGEPRRRLTAALLPNDIPNFGLNDPQIAFGFCQYGIQAVQAAVVLGFPELIQVLLRLGGIRFAIDNRCFGQWLHRSFLILCPPFRPTDEVPGILRLWVERGH